MPIAIFSDPRRFTGHSTDPLPTRETVFTDRTGARVRIARDDRLYLFDTRITLVWDGRVWLPYGPQPATDTLDDRHGDTSLNRWLDSAIDRVSRYVYGRRAPVDVGETAYRSSVRRETGTVGRDGEVVHLDLRGETRRIVFERPDLEANPYFDLPASDNYQDICFYDNLLYLLESHNTTTLVGYVTEENGPPLVIDASSTHQVTRGFEAITDISRAEMVFERTKNGAEALHLWVVQDGATFATTEVYGLVFTATVEGRAGDGWEVNIYGLASNIAAGLVIDEPPRKKIHVFVPAGTTRQEVLEELNDTLVDAGAPFHVTLAPGQLGNQQAVATSGRVTSPASAGGHGVSRLFRGDRTVMHRSGNSYENLAAFLAESDPTVIINGEVVVVSLVGTGSITAVAKKVEADVRLWGANVPSVAHFTKAVVRFVNGRFEFGIPGYTTLVLGGTTIEDMGLLPAVSSTHTLWEIDTEEDAHLTSGPPIAGMHYSATDKTLYAVLDTGQVHAIDRRWFGRPDTRMERRDFQVPEVGTVYSASTYEFDGTMTVAALDEDGTRRVHTLVFNPNIPIGEVRSVAKFLHRSVDVTDADDPGKTRGEQAASKWETRSVAEMYGVPNALTAADDVTSPYALGTGWWDLEDPRKFYFGEPVHNRGDVLIINVDTARGDVDYQVVRAAEGPAVSLQLPALIKQTLVGESDSSRNHANTLFRLEPKVYVLKTVFVVDTTDFPAADATDEFDLKQVGTRWTLKRVTPQQDDVVAVQVEGADYTGMTGAAKTVITDVQDEFEVFDSHDLHWLAMELSGGPTILYKDPRPPGPEYRRALKFQAVVELFEVVD